MPANRAADLQIVDPVLSRIARLYRPHGLIYDEIVSNIPVRTLAGQYPVFDDSYWFGFAGIEDETLSSDRAPSKEIDFTWSTEGYLCLEHALKVSITDLERQQADPALRLERNKTKHLEGRMALAREIRLAKTLMPAGDGGSLGAARTSTPSVNWDQDAATIEANIKTGVLDVYDMIGQVPTDIVIPYKVAYAMAIQEDIRAILRYDVTGAGINFLQVGSRVLPATIHGMRVKIPTGVMRNTAREGVPAAKQEIWGDHVRLLTLNEGGWGMPATVYRMEHMGRTITRWSEIDPDVDYIREKERYVDKVVGPDTAHVLKSVLS